MLKLSLVFYIFLFSLHYCECFVGFITTQIGPKALWNDTHLDKLKRDLLSSYDKYARPEEQGSNATTTKIALTIIHLETNEAKSTVDIQCLLKLKWTDSKLQWNPNDYGELGAIRIAEHEVWIPDIYLYNTAIGGDPFPRFGNRNVLIYSNGAIIWVPTVKYSILCTFDLRHWPFDTQHCVLKLGSWVHSGIEISLELDGNENSVSMDSLLNSSIEWKIDFTSEIVTTKYLCCKEDYPAAIFNMTLTRKSSPYHAIVISPAFFTTILILLQFWLPSTAKEKIILNGLTAIILNIFLLYFNHQVAKAGDTPLIVVFYSCSLYIVGFSMILAIINYLLCNLKNERPYERLMKVLLNETFNKWMLLEDHSLKLIELNARQAKINQEEDQDQILEQSSKIHFPLVPRIIGLEWQLVAVTVDRLSFLISFLFFIILGIALV